MPKQEWPTSPKNGLKNAKYPGVSLCQDVEGRSRRELGCRRQGCLDRETSLDMKHLVLGDMHFGVNIEGHHVKVIWELAVQIW